MMAGAHNEFSLARPKTNKPNPQANQWQALVPIQMKQVLELSVRPSENTNIFPAIS